MIRDWGLESLWIWLGSNSEMKCFAVEVIRSSWRCVDDDDLGFDDLLGFGLDWTENETLPLLEELIDRTGEKRNYFKRRILMFRFDCLPRLTRLSPSNGSCEKMLSYGSQRLL